MRLRTTTAPSGSTWTASTDVELDDRRRELARRIADHAHVVRPLVERGADGAESAGRRELAVHDEQHGVRELLHFLENVRRQHDRPSLAASCLQQPLEVHALPRIGAVERLVENEDFRIVHERRGETHALPHAARVRVHRPVLRVGEIDERDRLVDGAPRDRRRRADCAIMRTNSRPFMNPYTVSCSDITPMRR